MRVRAMVAELRRRSARDVLDLARRRAAWVVTWLSGGSTPLDADASLASASRKLGQRLVVTGFVPRSRSRKLPRPRVSPTSRSIFVLAVERHFTIRRLTNIAPNWPSTGLARRVLRPGGSLDSRAPCSRSAIRLRCRRRGRLPDTPCSTSTTPATRAIPTSIAMRGADLAPSWVRGPRADWTSSSGPWRSRGTGTW